MLRTHTNGELTAANIGETVTLTGWVARRRDHGGVAFVDLRDRAGVTQCVFHNEDDFEHLRNEYVLRVTGQVTRRPEGNENPNLATGEIEVEVSAVEVLNTAAPLPFQIDEHVEVGEEARLRYRYLDLRRPEPARIMRLRSDANRAARNLLADDGYLEVETPTLTRSTPEGARDFLVPARLAPGSWYALPQSPQLFKQLLQVGGIEKYYQIARCYRDEDFRADRQPEFTQLDIEASFVDQDDIIDLGERIVEAVWNLIDVQIPRPIRRMTYTEAMEKYGTDKPDLRFGLELTELTDYFANTTFRVFKAPYVGAVVMPGGASQPRRTLDAWQEWAKQRGAKGLAYVLVQEDGELTGPVAKNITDEERAGLTVATGANPGTASSSPPVKLNRRVLCWALPVLRSVTVPALSRTASGRSCGLWMRLSSSLPQRPPSQEMSRWGTQHGLPCTTPSQRQNPSSWIPSTRTPVRRWHTPTILSAMVTRSVAVLSVSTAVTCRNVFLRSWELARKKHRRSSASCWTPSSTAHLRWAVSHLDGIALSRFLRG
ncbi:Aspartate--tRNA ligase [Rothia dentocariosa]|uniref:Aspartate--tRNA ligase n=1 Tax=Rothia dentocariosa TaxID=2047 RepID=A0A3S4ZLV7_9MICC|nr:Aspartate--tRNA ligase [Rothia dentocariosa]